ncbi:MAG: heme biosynthesis HemY N-terminal domain-containing protein [Candidatus Berkiella sp.]
MIRLIIIMAALALAVWVGLNVEQSPGLMVVTFAGWRVDIPLWLAVILVTIFLIIVHYVVLLLSGMIKTASFIKNASKHYRMRRAKQYTHKGFIAFAEGNFSKAEKWLAKGAKMSENPWLCYLYAAKAAQCQGEDERRDRYLELAQLNEVKDHTEMAIGLTRAELAFEQAQYESSIATLLRLNEKSPNHPQVLRLLQQNYLHTKQWQALIDLLPKLQQFSILPKEQILNLERTIVNEQLIMLSGASRDLLLLQWHKIPRAMQLDSVIALNYAKALQKAHAPMEALEVLQDTLKSHWSEEVIEYYAQLQHPDPNKILTKTEQWLKTHPMSPGLLLALGQLCEKQQLWGKAQRYMEASLSLSQRPQTYASLGKLLEKMDKPELGAQFFKKGLLLVSS